jgi:tRNA 2-selenouridine synthase
VVALTSFLLEQGPVFDVRAPKEFLQGHIPGAISLPLFSDDERAEVGTCYKRVGKEAAIELGIKIVSPKLTSLLQEAKAHIGKEKQARVYCWRGGMRSGFISWFLNFTGIRAVTLQKGYKTFRHEVLGRIGHPYNLQVLGGYTGVGKTTTLSHLKKNGHQVIDLEAIAHHKGSAFGLSFDDRQPTCEQFENELGLALLSSDPTRPIWVEDESRRIGSCTIPAPFFETMKKSPLYFLTTSLDARVDNILEQYGAYPKEYLIICTQKLEKKLGREKTKSIVALIEAGAIGDAIRELCIYYDTGYSFAISRYPRSIFGISKEEFISKIESPIPGTPFSCTQ